MLGKLKTFNLDINEFKRINRIRPVTRNNKWC